MRRIGLLLLLVPGVLGLAGCTAGASLVTADELPALAEKTALSTRSFTASETVGGVTMVVEGLVEDDYRYSATVSLEGERVYEEVVVDDHRWVRLLAPAAIADSRVLADLAATDPNWAALLSREWVVDPAGAPPEFSAGATPIDVPLTAELVLAKVRFFDTAAEVTDLRLREYNQKAIYYLPKDDKFDMNEEDGTRFDHVPRAYDPNAVYTDLRSAQPFFEYVSVWADQRGWNRVERLMELPDPGDETFEDLYNQLGRAGSRRLLELIGTESGRRFAETWTFGAPPEGDAVAEPAAASPVDLDAALTLLASRLGGAPRTPLFGALS